VVVIEIAGTVRELYWECSTCFHSEHNSEISWGRWYCLLV